MVLTDLIETEEQLQNALQYWKDFSFNPGYIKLDEALRSMEVDTKPLVSAYHQFAPRWVVRLSQHITQCTVLSLISLFVAYQAWYETRCRVPLRRYVALEFSS